MSEAAPSIMVESWLWGSQMVVKKSKLAMMFLSFYLLLFHMFLVSYIYFVFQLPDLYSHILHIVYLCRIVSSNQKGSCKWFIHDFRADKMVLDACSCACYVCAKQ